MRRITDRGFATAREARTMQSDATTILHVSARLARHRTGTPARFRRVDRAHPRLRPTWDVAGLGDGSVRTVVGPPRGWNSSARTGAGRTCRAMDRLSGFHPARH